MGKAEPRIVRERSMSDFSISRLGPITKSGDGSVQPSQREAGRHRRQRPYPDELEQSDDGETSEEEKHDLDRLA
jgi:hypothetical protein